MSFPNGDGRLSLDPENEFHQINLSAAHTFSDDLRVNGRLSWGRMTQDDDFLDYTVNPLLTVNTGLPKDSLDGEITNTVVDLAAMWRPIHTLNLKASYRYDDRDNGTGQQTYKYIGGDAMNQPVTLADCSTTTGAGVSQCRTNLPVSSTEQKFKLQGDYEIFDRTKLDAGYEYEQVQRTYEARENTRQNSILVGVRRVQSEMFTGRLEYEYSDRNGSDYDALVPFNATYADPRFQIQQTGPYAGRPNWDTLPSLRKFHLADRERDKLRALGTITPTARTSIQVAFDYYKDDYNASDYGLTEGKGYTATLDASYAFSDKGSVFAFYTYDQIKSDQTGKEFTGAPSKYDREFDSRFDWTADLENVSNTFGLGGDYKLSDRLTLGALYVYNDSKGKTDVDTGPGLAAAQSVPDVEAKLNSLQLYAKYNLKENVALRFEYWYEQFSSDDWAYDGADPWSSNNVVTTGQDSSDYTDHVFGVAVQVKFQ